jgi:hypothetical protein
MAYERIAPKTGIADWLVICLMIGLPLLGYLGPILIERVRP